MNRLIHFCLIFVLLLLIPFRVSSNNKTCKNLEQLNLWLMGYKEGFQKVIIIIVDGLGPNDTQVLYFIPDFYSQYVQLVEIYNTKKPATFSLKNVGSFMFGEQLLTNFSTSFVFPMFHVVVGERLVEVHNKCIKGQDFAVNFEVCIRDFFSFVFF